jgi:tetratricopeptide (TPR) repeat protein
VVYELQGRHQEAAEVCGRAVSRAPDDLDALLCAGVAVYHLGRYAEAAPLFAAVVERDPASARGRYGLGLAKLYLGDLDGAAGEEKALRELDSALAGDLGERIAAER